MRASAIICGAACQLARSLSFLPHHIALQRWTVRARLPCACVCVYALVSQKPVNFHPPALNIFCEFILELNWPAFFSQFASALSFSV